MVYYFFNQRKNSDAINSTSPVASPVANPMKTVQNKPGAIVPEVMPLNKTLVSVQQEDLKLRKHQFLGSSDNLVVGL